MSSAPAHPPPTAATGRSRALLDATLRSEMTRVRAVVIVLLLMGAALAVFGGSQGFQPNIRIVGAIGGAVLLVIQVLVVLQIRRARGLGRPLPLWLLVGTARDG